MKLRLLWFGLPWLVLPAAASAQLAAPAPPDDPASAMFTLSDIYERLATGAPGSKRDTGFVEPSSPPGSTGVSLDDVMAVAPFPDELLGAAADQCLAGRRFWSLDLASWGPATGSMPNVGAQTILPAPAPQAIALGYHDGLGEVAGDADLSSGNIRAGVEVFGVAGDPDVVDTSSGDAAAGEIVAGRRAWVDGAEVVGTLPARTLSPDSSAVPAGLYAATTLEAVDGDLVSSNLRAGVTLFGVAGDPDVVDTSSGDAAAGEIAAGRRAWVDGTEVLGTLAPSLRFIDNGDGTVTDTRNGLVWLRDASCAELATSDSEGRVVFGNTLAAANALGDGVCGLTDGSSPGDWRRPTVWEVWSLVDPRVGSPTVTDASGSGPWVEGDVFVGAQADLYWTGTLPGVDDCPAGSCRWVVDFNRGGVVFRSLTLATFFWPVKR